MEVKISAGASRQQAQTQKKSAVGAADGASFAQSLQSAAKNPPATPEEAFARAFSDREHPDLQQLDDYLENRIQKELRSGGF